MSAQVMAIVQKAIYELLTGDTALMTMISGVYSNVPQNTSTPYVVFSQIQTRNLGASGNLRVEVNIDLNVYSQQKGNKELSDIMERQAILLDDATISLVGYSVVTIHEISSVITGLRDGLTRQGRHQFRLIIQEN